MRSRSVLLALLMVCSAGLVATIIGPPIFHEHLLQAGHQSNSPELAHIEIAYRDASLISVGVGLVISLLAATAVTWFLTRRLGRPLDQVTPLPIARATNLRARPPSARGHG